MSYPANIGNVMTLGILLEFETAFPGEKRLDVEEYLKGANRAVILKSASFLLGFNDQNSKYKENSTFLGMFFCKANKDFALHVQDRIKHLETESKRVGIINVHSSLKLFEHYFSKEAEEETQSPEEFELNLFKAYLVFNSEFTKHQQKVFMSTQDLDQEIKVPMMLFCMQYPVADKTNYDIAEMWTTQMLKAIYLFQFLESEEQAQPLLKAFLEHFGSRTWVDYLKSLVPLTLPAIREDNEAHTDIVIKRDENFKIGCDFLEKLTVTESEELDPHDFLTLRSTPFYKVEEGVYRIIFNLFVIEKIFKGVYFSLRNVNNTLVAKDKIKEIKSYYGHEFSEKTLCYNAVNGIYPEPCIKFSGAELDNLKIVAAPDFYVRKGKNIVLFESKDFLITAKKKMSFDFKIYEAEFSRILDYEELKGGKIKPKAITQLTNSIRKILAKEFKPDTTYNYREVEIYPILLTHDLQYDTAGFNDLIDYWFQDALLELQDEDVYVNRVKPITVVNVDSLLYYQVGLAESIPLHKVLRLYHKYRSSKPIKRKIKTQEQADRYVEELKEF